MNVLIGVQTSGEVVHLIDLVDVLLETVNELSGVFLGTFHN